MSEPDPQSIGECVLAGWTYREEAGVGKLADPHCGVTYEWHRCGNWEVTPNPFGVTYHCGRAFGDGTQCENGQYDPDGHGYPEMMSARWYRNGQQA